MNRLAETFISGDWLITAFVAVIGAAGAVWAKMSGKKEGRAETISISDPVPTVPIRKVAISPSWDQHKALADRVNHLEENYQELRRDMAGQYRELLMAGGERELRIADKLDGIARGIHSRIDEVIKSKGDTK